MIHNCKRYVYVQLPVLEVVKVNMRLYFVNSRGRICCFSARYWLNLHVTEVS